MTHACRRSPPLAAAAGVVAACVAIASAAEGDDPIRIGSKQFTESVVLGEILAGLARSAGVAAVHRKELGGTRIVWSALEAGQIDAYVEYTGTLQEEILAGEGMKGEQAVRRRLERDGIGMSAPLGFDNTYVLGMKESRAAALGIATISELREHPELTLGLSSEFMDREDGWPALRARYQLPHGNVRGLQHDLAYVAMQDGAIDVTDLYSTDAEIAKYELRTLTDDLHHFPEYKAVVVYRADLPAPVVDALRKLEGRIDAPAMVRLNARAKLDRQPETAVAADFLSTVLGVAAERPAELSRSRRVLDRTLEHLLLVLPSLAAAVLVSIPLGIVAARRPRLGQLILGGAGVIQTIPSLAILVFMIPLLQIGYRPSVVALFLYSLLPIIRNTHAGLTGIPPATLEAADAIGLDRPSRLRLVELPLASPAILAGVKTSAVINVGTATLGALIGAGGYGQPILTGIRLDDVGLILEGAVPAALLALVCQGAFDLAERVVVPRGLRLRA